MKVTVYGTTNCAFCKTERQWLDREGVDYEYVNLDEDEQARMFMHQTLDITTVPVTMVTRKPEDVEIVLGFDRLRLAMVIGL